MEKSKTHHSPKSEEHKPHAHSNNKSKSKPKPKSKSFLKKLWYFIWEEDSLASWVVNVVLAFILIKFLVYPGLGFVLGTTHPIVAVVSGSMEHNDPFDNWWSDEQCCTGTTCRSQSALYDAYAITDEQFKDFSFKNGFNKGDLMVLSGADNAEVGDVIVFITRSFPEPIIHRVVKAENDRFFTKGDNNCGTSSFEKDIVKDSVIGKAVFRIPFLGWIKIAFVKFINLFIGG